MNATATAALGDATGVGSKINKQPGKLFGIIFGAIVLIGLIYAGSQLVSDIESAQAPSALAYILLGIALFVALGFEFVNGFHDTANAVATVIYTHSLDPQLAVMWSGFWNFLGVLTSSGAVAFGIISLLPVELILQVGSSSGFAMVFALLVAAIIWNLGTWYFGLPASSSHTLIGSVIGVGLTNQLIAPAGAATSGVDWNQAGHVGESLLLSPLVGFALTAILLVITKAVIKDERLYKAPEGDAPPPFWIRGLLLLTCTGVSFAHGSNDGQKGMGLIMLILVGTVPTAYALNRAVPASDTQDFIAVTAQARAAIESNGEPGHQYSGDSRTTLKTYLRTREWSADVIPAMAAEMKLVSENLSRFKELKNVPPADMPNFRNDLYLLGESMRLAKKQSHLKGNEQITAAIDNYSKHVDQTTRFIPTWVKVAVALALGLGTMVGWKRIVVTVGEKIGKTHLTYAQGASAELVAAGTIAAADGLGLPVSTTHVLSSGIAGAMAANSSGLQWGTVRNLLLAWVLTLPVSIFLAGFLFWVFTNVF